MLTVILRKLLACLVLICAVCVIYFQKTETQMNDEVVSAASQDEVTVAIQKNPLKLNVTLKRIYLDGEISEEKVTEKIWALEDFWAKYEDWQLVDMAEGMVVFEVKMDDISPLLKVNGFFGVSDDGTLSIYNGKPEQEDIIQSFFQIDIKKLEGKKHLQLKQGIPVKTKEDFSIVLETMKQYSIKNEN